MSIPVKFPYSMIFLAETFKSGMRNYEGRAISRGANRGSVRGIKVGNGKDV
jgi:hypothetical protein